MNRKTLVATTLAILAVAGAGFAADRDHQGAHSGGNDLHGVMMSSMESMHSMKMTGDVDKDYAAMMIKHHEQAIAMNKVMTQQGTNAELKAMAQKMTVQQTKEIQELKRYAK
jgi:uncharacterized protein (DUF305 family)